MPVGTRLGEFEIRRVLGVGGFGIVYLAFDHLLEREVALKEYMPATLVDRNETLHVSLVSQEHADTFALGLRSFVNEARLLARFDHPSLVKVHRFWEANGTAYMAMALYKGRNARDVRAKLGAPPDEAWVRSMVEPLLGAIERLHSEDVYHRDIAPDNIMIEPDGRPVLLDFGAARRVITDRSQALTAILKPSYAPIEQYADVSGMKQGPWTDLYALGATMHFLLLGKPPPPAPGRSIQDTMKPLAAQALPGCTPGFLAVIDWMLAPLPTERPQAVAAVRDALAGRTQPPQRTPPSPFERTAAIEGGAGLGNEDATVIVPRGAPPPRPAADEDATVVIPRSAMAPPPRPAAGDEDATIISPRSSAFWIPPAPPPPMPPAPVPPAPQPPVPPQAAPGARPHTTQYAPRALAEEGSAPAPAPAPRRAAEDRPPPPVPKAAAPAAPRAAPKAAADSSSSWLTPVVAGVAAAAVIGGGLWWFLTRPAAEPPVANASPVTAAEPGPAPMPAPAPVAVEPTPAAAALGDAASAAAAAAPAPSPAPMQAPVAVPAPAPAPPPAATPRTTGPRTTEPPPRRTEPAPQPRANTAGPTAPPPQSQGAQPPPAPRQAPAPAPSPAPVPAPTADAAPPVDDRPKSPSERCAKELPLVRLICIDLTCNRSEFSKHPECVSLRAEQVQKRRLEGN
ncbi:MAG: serine/threonine-protein kinase [Rubrivivax sp.]